MCRGRGYPRWGRQSWPGPSDWSPGFLGLRALGIAAAVCLVLFFVDAMLTHVKAHVLYNIAFPGAFLSLSAASLALMLAR